MAKQNLKWNIEIQINVARFLYLYRTLECGAGLASLRLEHFRILASLRHTEQGEAGLEDRIEAVTNRCRISTIYTLTPKLK